MSAHLRSVQSHFIATLGTEPQVVTACLDLLQQQGEVVDQVTILHTIAPETPISAALENLQEVFKSPPYAGAILLRLEGLIDELGRPLADVDTPHAARAAFRALYRIVWSAKRAGRRVHLSIAGGRKTLAVFGMVTAQLLFDEDDRLWHLYSGGEFLQSRRMHPVPGDDVHLISIPVIRWSQVSPLIAGLSEIEDPFEAVARVEKLQIAERMEQARSFVLGALTPAEERAVALLVQEGLADVEIAMQLGLSPRTVEQHLRAAYQKAAAHWDLEDVNRAQLIALLNFYYSVQITGKPA